MPKHKHSVPVICFIYQGDVLVKIGDAPEGRATQGTTTYGAPEVTVHSFRNAWAAEPGLAADGVGMSGAPLT